MRKIYIILIFLLFSSVVYPNEVKSVIENDTSEVITLNKKGYNNRLTNPNETVSDADRALKIATKFNYIAGIAEATRIKGIGECYLNRPDSALSLYFEALTYYEKLHDDRGKAKVYNSIGNLYQTVDNDKALEYFNRADTIAQKYHDLPLIASLYMNIGNIYNRKMMYNNALKYYNESYELFSRLKDEVIVVQCLENLGSVYYNLRNFDQAKKLLLEANVNAKSKAMGSSIAAIDLTLTDLYVSEGDFKEADKYLNEGRDYSILTHNKRDIYDYNHTGYELELKRKNYEQALNYLTNIYHEDSTKYRSAISIKLDFLQKEQDRIVQNTRDQKNAEIARVRFWSLAVMAGLLLLVVALLINNIKRKAITNLQLQELNNEISRQKDNLDRINHHLEEIIDERTKDLQIKNKKLSEYSSYLSHQIRGPIATLKGLMNLEKEGLVDKQECINMMDNCVSEIDEKIIEMSDMLHDPGRTGFH